MQLFLISAPPDSLALMSALRVAGASAGYGEEVILFFFSEGVCFLQKDCSSEGLALLKELLALSNVRILYCAQDAEKQKVSSCVKEAEASSLIVLGKLIPQAQHCFSY